MNLNLSACSMLGMVNRASEILSAATEPAEQVQLLKNPDEYGDACLHLAAREGNVDIVNLLLEAAAKCAITHELLSMPNALGAVPLHLACDRGHPETVEALLAAGSPSTALDCNELTPLQLAAHGASVDCTKCVSLLLKASLKVGTGLPPLYNKTALHCAASTGSLETLQLLLDDGRFDINQQEPDYKASPLLLAVADERLSLVGELVRRGADPYNVRNVYDDNAFGVAESTTIPDQLRSILLKTTCSESELPQKQSPASAAPTPHLLTWRMLAAEMIGN